jgi:hypothetical protein
MVAKCGPRRRSAGVISDVLFEAVAGINSYLDGPVFAGMYRADSPVGARIRACVAEMDAIVEILDTPPSPEPPAGSTGRVRWRWRLASPWKRRSRREAAG